MKIITYNVNGIRAAINKGFLDWMASESPDVLCLQEIKATPDQIPLMEFEALGYKNFWFPAQKKATAAWPSCRNNNPIKWFMA